MGDRGRIDPTLGGTGDESSEQATVVSLLDRRRPARAARPARQTGTHTVHDAHRHFTRRIQAPQGPVAVPPEGPAVTPIEPPESGAAFGAVIWDEPRSEPASPQLSQRPRQRRAARSLLAAAIAVAVIAVAIVAHVTTTDHGSRTTKPLQLAARTHHPGPAPTRSPSSASRRPSQRALPSRTSKAAAPRRRGRHALARGRASHRTRHGIHRAASRARRSRPAKTSGAHVRTRIADVAAGAGSVAAPVSPSLTSRGLSDSSPRAAGSAVGSTTSSAGSSSSAGQSSGTRATSGDVSGSSSSRTAASSGGSSGAGSTAANSSSNRGTADHATVTQASPSHSSSTGGRSATSGALPAPGGAPAP